MFVLILHHSVWGGTPYVSSAPTQGHPSPGRSALSSLRIGERPCDTLRAHPENTARHLGEPSVHAEGRCRPNVTSGCPKRSEGGCPCRNEDEHRLSIRIPKEKHAACHPNQRGEDKHRPLASLPGA